MFTILPVRKLIKLVSTKRRLAKSERASSSTEGLSNNVSERSHLEIYFFIFILLLISHIYVIYLKGFYTNKEYVYNSSEEANNSSPSKGPNETLPVCFVDVKQFGPISVNKFVTDISKTHYTAVQRGGYYTPEDCRPGHKVALLVPYRNRKENLAIFLFNIHPFLMKQKLEYRIFIIEQKGTELFNRGRLFNAGFKEAKKYGSWKCVVFHDVDLLPLDERILYFCSNWPRHMCTKIVGIRLPRSFHTWFGGVSVMIRQQFEEVNGFSNGYWGWGAEDTDLYLRIRRYGLPVVIYNRNSTKYLSLHHPKTVPNKLRYDLLREAAKRTNHDDDGLSTLRYTVESVTLHHLYTHLLIDINPNHENVTEMMKKQLGLK